MAAAAAMTLALFVISCMEFFLPSKNIYRVDLFRGSPLPISKTDKQNWMKFCFQVAQNISETFANFDHKMSHHFWCMSAERCQLMGNIDRLQLMNQLTVCPQILAADTQNGGLSAAPKKFDEVA